MSNGHNFLDGCMYFGVRFEDAYLRLKEKESNLPSLFGNSNESNELKFEFGQDLVFGVTASQKQSLKFLLGLFSFLKYR